MAGFGETIAAIATPVGEGGLGVVRISGPEAVPISDRLFVAARPGVALAGTPGYAAHYGLLRDPETGERLDDCVALVMRAPHSYTGEDTVELSCHGGPYLLRRILSSALSEGARLAAPGEFTRRALLNGRLDLIQAEGVIDLIRAGSEAAHSAANRLLAGDLSATATQAREEILRLLASLEAAVDFPEEDIPFLSGPQIAEGLGRLISRLEALAGSFQRGRIAREGLRVVIAGRPNVGKSSLLNALLREERAIVTEVPGTTRDVIEECLRVEGVLVRLADTAGLRATVDPVERIGVAMAGGAVETADLVLLVLDGSAPLQPEDREAARAVAGKPVIVVLSKCDRPVVTDEAAAEALLPGRTVTRSSTVGGPGVGDIERALATWLEGATAGQGGAVEPAITRLRHLAAVQRAISGLRNALATSEAGVGEDFVAIDVREALEALGELLGIDAPDELLDSIFREFCIGK